MSHFQVELFSIFGAVDNFPSLSLSYGIINSGLIRNKNKKMQKIKRHLPLVVVIGILFATGMVFANAFNSQKGLSRLGIPVALGEDDEHDSEEADSEKDSKNDKKDSVDNENESDHEDGDKQDDEDSTEVRRAKTTTQGTKVNEDDDENDNEVDESDSEDEDKNDAQEEIQDLNKDINKVESKISVLGANGVNVTSFTATLSEIKDLASQATAKLITAPKEAETLIETADHNLERLEKLVKMTLGDEDENDDDNDATEEIQDLAKNVAKTEVKLNALSDRGLDVSAMKLSLNNIKDLLSQAKEKVVAGDLAGAEALTEVADKKMETLKHAMELAYGDDEEKDGDEAKEYKNGVAQFVHNLKEIGDMDGGIGQQVKVVAQTQNDSSSEVEDSINDVNSRSGFAKFLIGPKYGSIAGIQTAIAENQTRIKVLTDLVAQVADPIVKQVLQDQIKQFQQENTRLQVFVTESESGVSLLGWLMKMFS
ncbi:MAG: hypothetical protein COX31_02260 [Candidatus Moranbacteria bacterium CG23_combo_of_CG06-09_8_20_14_all_40_16]|nr:MAG: hypothetical protein COX31_02260 [Candidatus Moranbacteria bacterium CG23_combo_of_CG06-09_8_20_14_all_40_16]